MTCTQTKHSYLYYTLYSHKQKRLLQNVSKQSKVKPHLSHLSFNRDSNRIESIHDCNPRAFHAHFETILASTRYNIINQKLQGLYADFIQILFGLWESPTCLGAYSKIACNDKRIFPQFHIENYVVRFRLKIPVVTTRQAVQFALQIALGVLHTKHYKYFLRLDDLPPALGLYLLRSTDII